MILSVSFVSNYNLLPGFFCLDDIDQIVKNERIKEWKQMPGLFTIGVWQGTKRSGEKFYRPVAFLFWSVEYLLAGLNPFIFHLFNIILNALNSVALYLLLKRILIRERAALFAALLFACHPVHAEAVGWVSCGMDLLCTFFCLLSFWFFIKPFKVLDTVLSGLFFFMALLSKEAAIALPLALFVYAALYGGKEGAWRQWGKRLWPHLVATLVYAALRFYAVGTAGAGNQSVALSGVSPLFASLTMAEAFTHYIRLSFFPFNLSIDYLYPPRASFNNIRSFIAPSVLLAVIVFSKRIISSSKAVFFWILFFFIMLLPVSNIIPLPNIMSERALYLPSVGPCVLLGLAVERVSRRKFKIGILSGLDKAILVCILGLFVFGSHHRNLFWSDYDVQAQTELRRLERRIGIFKDFQPYYVQYAEYRLDLKMIDGKTEEALLKAIELDQRDADAYVLLGNLYLDRGSPDKALEYLRKAERFGPDNYKVYLGLGKLFGFYKEYGLAAYNLKKAVNLNPSDPDARYFLAWAYYRLNDRADAAAELKKTLLLMPYYPGAEDLLKSLQ